MSNGEQMAAIERVAIEMASVKREQALLLDAIDRDFSFFGKLVGLLQGHLDPVAIQKAMELLNQLIQDTGLEAVKARLVDFGSIGETGQTEQDPSRRWSRIANSHQPENRAVPPSGNAAHLVIERYTWERRQSLPNCCMSWRGIRLGLTTSIGRHCTRTPR